MSSLFPNFIFQYAQLKNSSLENKMHVFDISHSIAYNIINFKQLSSSQL